MRKKIHVLMSNCRKLVFIIGVVHVAIVAVIYRYFVSDGPTPLIAIANFVFYLPVLVLLEIFRLALLYSEGSVLTEKVMSVILIVLQLVCNVSLYIMNLHYLPMGVLVFTTQVVASLFGQCWFYIPAMLVGYAVDWILRQ